MFVNSLIPLFENNKSILKKLIDLKDSFSFSMKHEIESMWSKKLGLQCFNQKLVDELFSLMFESKVDYTKFFRRLSHIPDDIQSLKDSFYQSSSEKLDHKWNNWLSQWNSYLRDNTDLISLSDELKKINPKYTWREWIIASAYKSAERGDYSQINLLQSVFSDPYGEQSIEVERMFDKLRPTNYFNYGGISHYSCSS